MNKTKNLFALEALLRKEMSDDKFELSPDVLHEFSIGEYKEPEKPVTDSESDDEDYGPGVLFDWIKIWGHDKLVVPQNCYPFSNEPI